MQIKSKEIYEEQLSQLHMKEVWRSQMNGQQQIQ